VTRHARMALWAAAFTALLFVVLFMGHYTWVEDIGFAGLMPGLAVTELLRIRGGTDAFPMPFGYTFAFTFLIYWLLFEIGYPVWRTIDNWIGRTIDKWIGD